MNASGSAVEIVPPAGRGECGGPVSLDELRDLIAAGIEPVAPRWSVPGEALGATLAEPVVAGTPLPRVDTAAMDGYAVRGPGPVWSVRPGLRLAGGRGGPALEPGSAVRIATGAPTPVGTTEVLRDEHVVHGRSEWRCTIARAPGTPAKDDTRRIGEHWTRGQVLVEAGTAVCPAVVSTAASAESPAVAVRGPLRADVLITGDEIRADGPLATGQTRDALSPVLPEYLRACGIRCEHIWRLEDDADLLRSWCATSRDAELVIVAGGTGRGAADHLRAVLADLGARTLVDGVAMRPGGSQLVAVLPDGRTLLGLPGNPFAAIAALLVTGPAIVHAATARSSHSPIHGRVLGRLAPTGTDTTRVVPVRQVRGGVWQSAGSVQTPHLADLIGCQALALIGPSTASGGLAEMLPLPR